MSLLSILTGGERKRGGLEGGDGFTLVTATANRGRARELNSIPELEDEANGNRSRLLVTEIDNIAKSREEGTRRGGGGPLRIGTARDVVDRSILIAINRNRIDIMGEGRGVTARGPNNHLSRRIISHNTGVNTKLSRGDIVKVTIPGEIEGVIGNTSRGGHDLGADLNRTRLNTKAVIHHTGIEDTTGVGVNGDNRRRPGENIAKGEGGSNALGARSNGERNVHSLSKGHGPSLRVVHLSTARRGGIVPAIGATVGATVGATAIGAGGHLRERKFEPRCLKSPVNDSHVASARETTRRIRV